MGVSVRNSSGSPVPLPSPLRGILGPGEAKLLDASAAELLTAWGGSSGGLKLTDIPADTGFDDFAIGALRDSDTTNDPKWSSLKLTGVVPEYGRLLVRSFPNPTTTFHPHNTVACVGVGFDEAGNQADPSLPAAMACFERVWHDVRPQSEVYLQIKWDGDEWRPFYSRFYLDGIDAKTFDNQLRGKTVHLGDDGSSNVLATFNPEARIVQLADDVELRATGGAASVTVRGVILSGAREIKNNTNTPVKLAGAQMSGTSTWHHFYPRTYDQAEEPVLPDNASGIWRDTDDDSVWYVFKHPSLVQKKVQLT